MNAYTTEVKITVVTWGNSAEEARQRLGYAVSLISIDYEMGGGASGFDPDYNAMADVAEWMPTGRTRRLPERDAEGER